MQGTSAMLPWVPHTHKLRHMNTQTFALIVSESGIKVKTVPSLSSTRDKNRTWVQLSSCQSDDLMCETCV